MTARPLEKIVLVEDDTHFQEVALISLVSIGGYTVKVCDDGMEAVLSAPKFVPDLILMDLMMPNMDGPTTIEELRNIPETADIPVVLMTAKVQAEDRRRYDAMGALGVIAKPFDPLALTPRLEAMWEAHHMD